MKYLQIVGTVLCAILALIAWELHVIADRTGSEVSGSIDVRGNLSVDVENDSLDPIGIETR
jgi:hypothetical protein